MTNLENYYKSIASKIGYKRNSSDELNTIQNNILTNTDDKPEIHKGGTKDSKKSTDDIPLNVITIFNGIGKKQVDEFLENEHLKPMNLDVYFEEGMFKLLKNLPNEYISGDDYSRLLINNIANDIKSDYTNNHVLIANMLDTTDLNKFNNILERLNFIYNNHINMYFLNFDIESMFRYVEYNYFEYKILPKVLLDNILEYYTTKQNDNHDIKLCKKSIVNGFKVFKKFYANELYLTNELTPLFDKFIFEDDVGYMHIKINSNSYMKFLNVNLSNIEETLQNLKLD